MKNRKMSREKNMKQNIHCEYTRDEKTKALKVNILIALPHSQLLTGFYFSIFFSFSYDFLNEIWACTFYYIKTSKYFEKWSRIQMFKYRSSFAIWEDVDLNVSHVFMILPNLNSIRLVSKHQLNFMKNCNNSVWIF